MNWEVGTACHFTHPSIDSHTLAQVRHMIITCIRVPCTVSYFVQVSIHIVEEASKDHKTNAAIFREFIKNFRAIIDSKTSGHRELAVAIKGYGYFAAVS